MLIGVSSEEGGGISQCPTLSPLNSSMLFKLFLIQNSYHFCNLHTDLSHHCIPDWACVPSQRLRERSRLPTPCHQQRGPEAQGQAAFPQGATARPWQSGAGHAYLQLSPGLSPLCSVAWRLNMCICVEGSLCSWEGKCWPERKNRFGPPEPGSEVHATTID